MAIFVIGVLIGVIVFFQRRGRREYIAHVAAARSDQTWTFNVRDMEAELHETKRAKRLARYELRRSGRGRWEMAATDPPTEHLVWVPVLDPALDIVEAKFVAYNDTDADVDDAKRGAGPYRTG